MTADTAPVETETERELRATPVTLGTQELRAATAMTGGVSLAIWMGGVARELNLLEQASRRRETLTDRDPLPIIDGNETSTAARDAHSSEALYLRLLDVLDLTAHVDILSGTSAGGINAALLGFTRARRLDLGPLRDVWLKTGSFELLLRDPTEKSPPSLLQGDGVLLKGLRDGIATLGDGGPTTAATDAADATPTTEVFITTTLLSGETGRFTDAFGTLVQDVDHRGIFKFDEVELARPDTESALAMASRCSASFPGAFEPAYVRWGKDPSSKFPLETHPDMAPYANTTRSHFVADGGLLMNRPIKPLLEAVFDRPAKQQVRRVLLYVVPSPGDAPDPTVTPPPETLPTFGGALLKDVGAAVNQSISAELRAIRDHNDDVGAMADTRLRVAEIGYTLGLDLLKPEALADYRRRQSKALAASTVSELMRGLTTMSDDDIPPDWEAALTPGSDVEIQCRRAAADAIATGWPIAPPPLGDIAGIVAFGRPAYDGAKATAVAMLRAGWMLATSSADRAALATATNAVHSSLNAPTRPSLAEEVSSALSTIGQTSPQKLPAFAGSIAGHVAGVREDLEPLLADAWTRLATALLNATPTLVTLASAADVPSNDDERSAAKAQLATYLKYLVAPEVPAAAIAPSALGDFAFTIARLFQLHVVTRSMLPVAAAVEQHVDLIQVSADTRSALAPAISTAKDKLTGMQLHHFGAFYKSSWRANDWMWGRLDGAGWLVHLLLDPRRILVLAESAAAPKRAEWFLERLAARIPKIAIYDPAVRKELAYLDDPKLPIPTSLPHTSMRVAAAWQRRIAVWELPVIAREVVANPSLHTNQWAIDVLALTNTPASIIATVQGATAAFASGARRKKIAPLLDIAGTQPPPDLSGPDTDQLVERLRDCPIRKETLGGEVGEPLFTRTVTRAAAVTTAATAETPEIPAVLRPVLATVRATTLLAYRLAAVTRGRARAVAGVGLGALALGTLLATRSETLFGLAGGVLIVAGIYLLLLVAWKRLKSIGDWIKYLLVGLAVAVAVALAFPSTRTWLFGDGKKNVGLTGRHVIPWLRDSAWPAPIVFLVVTLLVVGVGYLIFHDD